MSRKTASRGTSRKRAGGLTRKLIEQHVGQRSFRLGEDYFEQGAVFDCRRQGTTLKAHCQGRSADSYVIEADLKGSRIDHARCNCPVGGSGHCKHVAAVLLMWAETPDEFREMKPIEELLAESSKEELIALVGRMIEKEPDLQSWLELSVAASRPGPAQADVSLYREQAEAAFEGADWEWGANREVAAELESIKAIGDRFRADKEHEPAAAVYCGILDAFVSESEEGIDDESGELASVACECVSHIAKCLPEILEDAPVRKEVLRSLFEFFEHDVSLGGSGLSDGVSDLLTKHATPTERKTVVGWIRKRTSAGEDALSEWRRGAFGRLLLDLEESELTDEQYLAHCREFGLTYASIDRLLKLKRLDEALRAISQQQDGGLPGYADLLVSHRQAELAERLMRERLGNRKDDHSRWNLEAWLERFYEGRKNWQALLDLKTDKFRRRPSVDGYKEIRKVAGKLKKWTALQPKLMEAARAGKEPTELIRILLLEDAVAEAIELVASLRKPQPVWVDERVQLEVARAAEKDHPEAALKLYAAEAEFAVSGRDRERYKEACKYLKKVRDLYGCLGREADWNKYITALCHKNRTLRAFQEEVKRAGL